MRQDISLNFDWFYKPDFSEDYLKDPSTDDFVKVMIPHTNKELPYNNFNEKDYQFISSYKKTFTVPSEALDNRVILYFGAVMTTAEVYLNGKKIAFHEGGFTPFQIDITDNVEYQGENHLFVKVDSHEIKDIPPFGNVVDYLCYGGIYREVFLQIRPKEYIEQVFIKTLEAPSLAPDEMTIDISLELNTSREAEYVIEVNVLDETKAILTYQTKKTFSKKLEFRGLLTEITRWDLDNPKLYTVEIIVKSNDCEVDRILQRVGFRSAEFTTEGFILNNQKLKLIGLNRHQSYPYVGFAMPKRIQEKDADLLKFDLGCNIVRTSHYMQSDHFINRCDEIGLLVFEEIPGWQYIGDDHFKDLSVQNLSDMIKHHINHPSIVLWGVRINESPDDHDFYQKTNEIARSIDDSRQIGGVRNFKKSELIEDVYTYNDFSHVGNNEGLSRPQKITGKIVPYLVTENNGHIFPTKKFDHEDKRREHALRHLAVLDSSYKSDLISGAIGWCMNDYNTHVEFGSGDRICYHGVQDMFRIPKYAASVFASQQTKRPVLTVASNMTMGDYAKSMVPPTVIFTNCDYVKVYRNNRFIDTFYSAWDTYKAIPFAPVIVDDYIGNLILEDESFKPRVANRIKKVLTTYYRNDFFSKLKNGLRMADLALFHKIGYSEALRIYGNYIGDWGKEGGNYLYEGYINDQCVICVRKGANQKALIQANPDDTLLIHDVTYDATRIVVKKVDEFGNDLVYANDILNVSCSEQLAIIGPNQVALIGGSFGIYVKTTGVKGKGTVTIATESQPKIVISIEVQ
jgi:beta-galactosidase